MAPFARIDSHWESRFGPLKSANHRFEGDLRELLEHYGFFALCESIRAKQFVQIAVMHIAYGRAI